MLKTQHQRVEGPTPGLDSVDQPREWQVAPDRTLALDRAQLIGILNVTPDSFSDGGLYHDPGRAVDQALRMIDEGASIIDVGGESTRPGAAPVAADEQIRRAVPVVEGIRRQSDVLLSIDTTCAAVAERALDRGADIINDISAGRDDNAMLPLAASRRSGIILMHRLRPPREDHYSDRYIKPPQYDDVIAAVREFLRARVDAAIAAGVSAESIVIDPGLGFGKTVEQNYELIGRIDELHVLGRPVLSAASRKSFVGKVSGRDEPRERVAGSIAVSVAHYLAGVRLYRVHDVAAHREALAVAEAIAVESAPGTSAGG